VEKNNKQIKTIFFIFFIIVLFSTGLVSGYFIFRQGPAGIGETDSRYYYQYGRLTEIIGRIENELGRERENNRKLREHNSRARELTDELTGTAERNVRNLQDAISLIGEIRRKLQVLADFYDDSDPGNSSP